MTWVQYTPTSSKSWMTISIETHGEFGIFYFRKPPMYMHYISTSSIFPSDESEVPSLTQLDLLVDKVVPQIQSNFHHVHGKYGIVGRSRVRHKCFFLVSYPRSCDKTIFAIYKMMACGSDWIVLPLIDCPF